MFLFVVCAVVVVVVVGDCGGGVLGVIVAFVVA